MLSTTACQKETPIPTPVIHLALSPSEGNTTQTFTFDLTESESGTNRSGKVFARWDWDGDGNWDTPFTRLLVYDHRYYAPGTWNPKVEMSNINGSSDTLSLSIRVARGYSAPKPKLTIAPETGHIYTRFLLDASGTRDDEDSLNTLVYRWDFNGDGQWDTGFGDSVRIHHVYPETGFYKPAFQVRDPSGLISIANIQVTVTLEDSRLLPSFTWMPDSVTDHTEITMDASASTDQDNPDKPLYYRWDWNNDGSWDTGWQTSPVITHIFETELFHYVRLQVRSYRDLFNEVTKKIRVYHKNRPPVASFTLSTLAGNVNTEFRFDAWSTRDMESSPGHLFYRWDFNGDGTWDMGPVSTPDFLYKYPEPGIFNTVVEVTDSLGASNTFSKTMSISRGTNETGRYLDTRGNVYEHYGTVRIGDLLWFTRSFAIQDASQKFRKYNERSYDGDQSMRYRDYGNLYEYDKLPILCPDGWRVPSQQDWENLFAHYPEDDLYDALMPGGLSDFGATLGGKGNGAPHGNPGFDGLGEMGYFWSTTLTLDPTGVSVWIVTFDRANRKVLKGFAPKDGMWYGVRCVRDR